MTVVNQLPSASPILRIAGHVARTIPSVLPSATKCAAFRGEAILQLSCMSGRKPFTLDDEPRVLAALEKFPLRDQAAFLLGTNTGFRATELLSLNVGDVSENGHIRKSVTVARRRLKGGRGCRRKGISSRTVPLNEAATTVLRTYLFSRFGSGPAAPQEPLFPSRFHGLRLTRWRLNLIVKAVLQKAGVGSPEYHGTHSLRKTFCQFSHILTGRDINLTRQIMGHANVSTTQKYLFVDEREVTRVILELGRRPAAPAATAAPAVATGT